MINLRDLSPQEVQALKRLRAPGQESVAKLLSQLVEGAKRKLVHADDMVMIHRLQGRAEAFEDLLRAIDESATVE